MTTTNTSTAPDGTAVTRLEKLRSMTAVPVTGAEMLAVRGRHETRALTDACPQCLDTTVPAAVLDIPGSRGGSRVATYRCCACGAAWLCSWGRA